MAVTQETVRTVQEIEKYKYGFVTDIDTDTAPKGLNEDIIRFISARKEEPQWLLDWRLKAYGHWLTMEEPDWAKVGYPPIDYQDAYYYSAPKSAEDGPESLDEGRPGSCWPPTRSSAFPLQGTGGARRREERCRRRGVRQRLGRHDIQGDPRSPRGHLLLDLRGGEGPSGAGEEISRLRGSLLGQFFCDAQLARSSPTAPSSTSRKGVRCPMELSTYFRINAANTGQFERTLIIADEGSYVSYLEGCTAPMRDENQLHAAVVELVALDDAEIKYSTVQNWYPGDENGKSAASTTSSPSGAPAAATTRRSPGPRSRPARRLPGSIRAASCRATTVGRRVLLHRHHQQLPAGRHRHQDDPPGQEHQARGSFPRASRPANPRPPTAAWSR